jgi:hypothetical protein
MNSVNSLYDVIRHLAPGNGSVVVGSIPVIVVAALA